MCVQRRRGRRERRERGSRRRCTIYAPYELSQKVCYISWQRRMRWRSAMSHMFGCLVSWNSNFQFTRALQTYQQKKIKRGWLKWRHAICQCNKIKHSALSKPQKPVELGGVNTRSKVQGQPDGGWAGRGTKVTYRGSGSASYWKFILAAFVASWGLGHGAFYLERFLKFSHLFHFAIALADFIQSL